MNRKLRKLLRHPVRYFLDAPRFARLSDALGYVPKRDKEHAKARRHGLGSFKLVGNNWAAGMQPIAVAWGLPPHYAKVIHRYVPEFRVALAEGTTLQPTQRKELDALADLTFLVYGEPTSSLLQYANGRSIPLIRTHEGFICSAEPRSELAKPMSMVFDRTGIYFDSDRPSDLVRLLEEYDFSTDKRSVEEARALLQVFRALKISKFGVQTPATPHLSLGVPAKARILVLGEQFSSATTSDRWTDLQLVELACTENPDAEVIFRPHPKLPKATSHPALRRIEKQARVYGDDIPLPDLFGHVERVYAISSLGGLEALLHNKPVTVVGRPFYAGWGLTDDRCEDLKRARALSLEELFLCTYVLYPRYLGAPAENPSAALLAAMLRMVGRRRIWEFRALTPSYVADHLEAVGGSAYWPLLLANSQAVSIRGDTDILAFLPLQRILAQCGGHHFQTAVAALLLGHLRDTANFERALTALAASMRRDSFAAVINDLIELRPSTDVLLHWAKFCEQTGRFDEARSAFKAAATNEIPEGIGYIDASQAAATIQLAGFELRSRRLDDAFILFRRLLVSGYTEPAIFDGIAEIARLRFDFPSSTKIMEIFICLKPKWKRGRVFSMAAQAAAVSNDPAKALEWHATACLLHPQLIEAVPMIEVPVTNAFGRLPLQEAFLIAAELRNSTSKHIARAKAFIASGAPAYAERLLLGHKPDIAETVEYSMMLSLAYSEQGKDRKSVV